MSIPHPRVIARRFDRRWGSASRVMGALLLSGLFGLTGGCASTQHRNSAKSSNPRQAVLSPVARGRELYQADGCSGCHSLDGTRGTGPSWKGLAGSQVKLSDGRTLTA